MHLVLCFIFYLSTALVHAHSLSSVEQDLTDSVITTLITTKYTENKHLNPLKISVTTQNGVVKLHGHVKNKDAFIEALKIALDINGVQSVDAEDLEIKHANTSFTDAFITTKAELSILKAKLLDNTAIPLVGINATTTNGVVTLSGKVNDDKCITAILRRVNEVHGVKKIVSRLQVTKKKRRA